MYQMNSARIAIVKAIQANDGKLSWYQLDREITQRTGGVDPTTVSKDLMPTLRELEQADIIATIAGHHPAQRLYSLTPAGRQLLESHEARDGVTIPSTLVNKSR